MANKKKQMEMKRMKLLNILNDFIGFSKQLNTQTKTQITLKWMCVKFTHCEHCNQQWGTHMNGPKSQRTDI